MLSCFCVKPAVDSVSFTITPASVCNSGNDSVDLNTSCSLTLFASFTPVQWANAVNGSSPSVVIYVALKDTDIYMWDYAPTVSTSAPGVLITPSPSALSPTASLAISNTPAPGACGHDNC